MGPIARLGILFISVLVIPFGSYSLGATGARSALPSAPQAVTSSLASRAKVEIAIRRIRSLLIVEKGQNEERFDDLISAQKDLQGRN